MILLRRVLGRILGCGFRLDSGKDSSVEDPGEDSRVDYGVDSGRICLCRLLGRILEQIVGSESKVDFLLFSQ